MTFYCLTEAGAHVASTPNNPNTPAYIVLAKLRYLRRANTNKLMEATGFDLGTTQLAISQLLSSNPPLIMAC